MIRKVVKPTEEDVATLDDVVLIAIISSLTIAAILLAILVALVMLIGVTKAETCIEPTQNLTVMMEWMKGLDNHTIYAELGLLGFNVTKTVTGFVVT